MHIWIASRGNCKVSASPDLQVVPVSKSTSPIELTSEEARPLCNDESAQGTAGKWRRSASSMYRKMLAWGAPIKTAAGYGAAATAGGATAPTVAGSVMGFFAFSSVGIVKGSTASHMMAAAGGTLKAGSWCSFWQSASTGGMYASYVFGPCTLGMSIVGVFAYSKRREMYQRMTSIYKKFKG